MPVDKTNPYTDVAHESTKVGADYRYGCKNRPESTGPKVMQVRRGYRPNGTIIFDWTKIDFKNIPCGHMTRTTDKACGGCKWQHQ